MYLAVLLLRLITIASSLIDLLLYATDPVKIVLFGERWAIILNLLQKRSQNPVELGLIVRVVISCL